MEFLPGLIIPTGDCGQKWKWNSPLGIMDKSESKVIGAQLYVDGPFLYWNSLLGLLSPLEIVGKSESEVIGV